MKDGKMQQKSESQVLWIVTRNKSKNGKELINLKIHNAEFFHVV